MPNYVTKKCKVCNKSFTREFKKRHVETCNRKCSYSLRMITRKIKHSPLEKICLLCNKQFNDTSKKKLVTKCYKCIRQQGVDTRNENGSYERTDEQNKKLSDTLKKKYASGEIKLSDEGRKRLSDSMKLNWESGNMDKSTKRTCQEKYGVDHWMKTDEAKKQFSERLTGRTYSKETIEKMSIAQCNRVRKGKETLFSNGNGRYREDLDCYFRSNWEANFARICNHEKRKWEYEPKTFRLSSGKGYTPDFLVEGTYYEIKGKWWPGAKEKFNAFKDEYSCKIELIDSIIYQELRQKYKSIIQWEGK
jgi:hypothetical protein